MKNLGDMLIGSEQRHHANCEKHGEFTSRNILGMVWSRCPSCENDRLESDAREAEKRAQEDAQANWRARIGHSGIPDRFRDRTLDTYVAENPGQAKALKFAKTYAYSFDEVKKTGQSALFIGLPGTGKTHLAVGIGLHIMPTNSVLFTSVIRATRRVKDTWSRDSQESESHAIAALVYPSLLILDEVGVQFGSETEKLILFDVLNERYEKRKPTILLSNLSLDDVRGYLGERVFDRLREDGGKFIVFDWDSYRGRK